MDTSAIWFAVGRPGASIEVSVKPEEIKALKELCEKFKGTVDNYTCCDFANAAREAVPKLIAEVESWTNGNAVLVPCSELKQMQDKLAQAVEVLKIIAFGKEAGPYSAMHRIRKARALLKEWGVE